MLYLYCMFNKTLSTLKQIMPFLFFVIILNSCDSEIKPITFKTASIDTKYEADISVIYDKAIETNALGKTINFNIEKTIISTLSDASKKTNLVAVLEDFNLEYINFKTDFPEESEPVWELHIETEKSYQSEEIITIAISTYEFKGGAHGNDKLKFLNLNAKTGAVLEQSDILKNIEDFKTLAKSYFIKSLETQPDEDKNETIEDFFFGEPFQLPENIGFSDDGLVLLYNIYEIATYDEGYTEFAIPFEEAATYLKIN